MVSSHSCVNVNLDQQGILSEVIFRSQLTTAEPSTISIEHILNGSMCFFFHAGPVL